MNRRTPSRRRVILGAIALAGAASGATGAWAQSAWGSWPGRRSGAVSLTYDDGHDSHLDIAAPALEQRGWRGTFYITEQNMAGRASDWAALARRGHEVEDHTVDHPCALSAYDAASFEARELRPMERFLAADVGAPGPHTYAYPCGYLGLGRGSRLARYARYQRIVRREFTAARTTAGDPNAPDLVSRERFHLHAFEPTYEADVVAPARRYLELARARRAWAILVFHDIVPRSTEEGDTSVATHERILDLVDNLGLWCDPVGRVLRRLI